MEECCAVCAEPLEWVAYGPCGHREACFNCVARLRFILEDKHCCICKQECPAVFVTKALGEYTRVMTDWQRLQTLRKSSRPWQENLWYDDVVEAYFDDEQPFKIIRAMYRPSCSICEKAGAVGDEGEAAVVVKGMVKRGHSFKNIDALRRHLSHTHKVSMCRLCLEGRKVFVSEQKLYTHAQLRWHFRRGDLKVDGSEEERGAFDGHPRCRFCNESFYGDNDLYHHNSREHYTCHLCQRIRPGQYEYYRDYDDLEEHFRHGHSLCEDLECLARKFVVFPSELELRRHHDTTHRGRASLRAQRSADVQIPATSHHRQTGQSSSDDNSNNSSGSDSQTSFRRGGEGPGGHHTDMLNARNDRLDAAAMAAGFQTVNIEHGVRGSHAVLRGPAGAALTRSEAAVIFQTTNAFYPHESARTRSEAAAAAAAAAMQPTNVMHREGGMPEARADVGAIAEPSRYLAAARSGRSSAVPAAGAGRLYAGSVAFPPLPETSQSAARQVNARNDGPKQTMAALLSGNGSPSAVGAAAGVGRPSPAQGAASGGLPTAATVGISDFPPLPESSQSVPRQAEARNQGPQLIGQLWTLRRENRSGRSSRAGVRVLNLADQRREQR